MCTDINRQAAGGSAARAGNALIAAMGIVVLVSGVILVSATNAAVGVKNQTIQRRQTEALAALEAVLTRRETMVTTMALNGNPSWPSLIEWDGVSPPNYGMDVVGDCLVRWRIEPGRTLMGTDVNPSTPPPLKYILNPPPDGVSPNADANAVQNGFSFLYRVVAEAEYPARNAAESPSVAQGARYVSVSAQPTFRWVINYTRNGPLGDLELSHDPAVTIRGSINSNGSIYMGSNLQVNDWTAVYGGSGSTLVGPDVNSAPVVASGYDGIYRLSKPNSYGFLNKFPMSNGPSCTDPTTLMTLASGGGTQFFADLPGLNESSWSTLTMNGRFINPYRILDAAGLTTIGSGLRQINGNSLVGSLTASSSAANDSRDFARTGKFATQAPGSPALGFNNFARTGQTTARREVLSKEFSTRALEPQKLIYRETDGDVLTDDHDFATPEFYLPTSLTTSNTTLDPIAAANAVRTIVADPNISNYLVEVPGHYVKAAIGSGNAMARLSDGTGWVITNPQGVQVNTSATTTAAAGIVIRERPVPQTDAWPASTDPTRYIQYSDPQALPYALGKHWRPVSMPFTPIDITDNLYTDGNDNSWANIAPFNQSTPTGGWDRSANFSQRAALYRYNGNLFLIGGHGVDTTEYDTSIKAAVGPSPGLSYRSAAQYHTAAWRLVHLKNRYGLTDTQILAQPQGLRYSYWNDDSRRAGNAGAYVRPDQANNKDMGSNDPTRQPLLGTPVVTGVATTLSYGTNDGNGKPWLPAATPVGPAGDLNNFYSVRWEGFLVPPASGSYAFQASWDDGIRIWIDDRLITENWGYTGSSITTNPFTLVANRPAKIVIDFNEGNGGDGLTIRWSGPGLPAGFSDIPKTAMRTPPTIGGFDRTKLTSITARIDTAALATLATGSPTALPGLTALQNPKIGLMLRPDQGEPEMVNGRDAYVALCWSPSRGVFLERRMNPARVANRLSTAQAKWIGNGTYTVAAGASTPADLDGVIPTPIGYTGSYSSVAYTVNRSATINCAAAPTPTVGTITSSTNKNWSSATLSSPSAGSVNLGDGTTVTVTSGPYRTGFTPSSFIKKNQNMSRTYTWTITGGTYPAARLGLTFPIGTGSTSQALSLFSSTTTTTTTTNYATLNNNSYSVPSANTINVGQSQNVTSTGTTVTGTQVVVGDSSANNIWQGSGWPSGYTGATLVAKLNSINWGGRSDWQLGNGTGNNPAAPGTFPTLSPVAPADPSLSGLPVLYDTNAHSFAMDVTPGYSLYMDSNPFVTRSGTWSSAPVAENRPWGGVAWNAYKITPLLTQSFRPDLANLFTLGTGSVALTEASTANAAAAPTPASGALAPVPWSDDIPMTVVNNSVWLRINRSATNVLTFQYTTGATAQPNGQWIPSGAWINLSTTEPVVIGDAEWASMLAGPAIQSGNVNTALQTSIDSLSVATSENIGNNDGVWDYRDWDGSSGLAGVGSPLSRYYASQYQVFFGIYDITEDFFTWGDRTGNAPVATEDWFYNPREFWSQSDSFQYWDSSKAFESTEPWGVTATLRPNDNLNYVSRWNPLKGWVSAYSGATGPISDPYALIPALPAVPSFPTALLKDVGGSSPWTDTTNRRNWAKTTVLILNAKSLATYLKGRDLAQAKTQGLLAGTSTPPAYVGPSLAKSFNGILYAARTNRYPFNPNQALTDPSVDPAYNPSTGVTSDPTRIGGVNPWSFQVRPLSTATIPDSAEYLNYVTPVPLSPKTTSPNYTPLTVAGTTATWTPTLSTKYYRNGVAYVPAVDSAMSKGGIHKLQPYAQIKAFPVRPQQFLQGVMLTNGSLIDWGISAPATDNFGAGGTSIVTPNALYVQGNFNSTTTSVLVSGVPTNKVTPVALMADSVTFLSNSFSIATFQRDGLTVAFDGTVTGSGILANPTGLALATTTTYNAGIITHNQPTTQARVLEGQGAAFVDTMLFLENWSGVSMNYLGSLVVMDTRRYTDAFLLDGNKSSGRSPLGYLGWAATIESGRSGPGLPAASAWPGPVKPVYIAPSRNLDYQFDFRTAAGTPPQVPNGMTSVGVGGWTRVIQ